MNEAAPVLPGETLAGKYRVERVLGEGGMGIVVAARHLTLDERVAIKFLLGGPSEDAVERFTREARAAVKVKGEHVCRVFDFGRLETGEPYIVMEYMEGTDLARKIAHDGRQPASLVACWMIETCDAIAEAHALGIVHRDLKPANVFLANRPDGSSRAKVLDFGISKLPAQQMTKTKAMMGSPAYMSPEQLESAREVDARADVWSLGTMLYELLTGKPPFVAGTLIELAVQIRERDPAPMEDVPEELAKVVTKCLQKKAADRYPSAAELALALAPFAPPEALGILSRLRRRMSEETISKTPDPEQTKERPSTKGVLDVAQETFAPLQTTQGSPVLSKRPAALVALALALAAGIGALALRSNTMPPAAPSGTTTVAADVHVEAPTQAVASSPPPALPPSVASIVPIASSAPVVTTVRPIPRPAPSASIAAPPSVTPSVVAAASSTSPPPAPPPSTKRRTLDRDDP
jgi:eukaryotic-like serine/threonine-protein kinase